MDRKDRIDGVGAAALVAFAVLLGFNQVVIKVSTAGIEPIFMAGLRSVGALVLIWLWCWARGITLSLPRKAWAGAVMLGLLFTAEFIFLYLALDWTNVARASIIFYSMPIFVALAAHFLIPGETMSGARALGLVLAMLGVAWVMAKPGEASIGGDIAALMAAISWAGIALVIRVTPLSEVTPEAQQISQLTISSVLLLALSPLFGPMLRDPTALHWAGLGFQTIAVASFGYLFWYFLMKRYPASAVASFSFLSPVFGVGFGWQFLDEPIGMEIVGGLSLVAVGITLINRR
ncbi:DMT family transporter [Rhodalgimonas zhirmunskyi]|uniref:DMT family transporter n=1 Tax=Rhodalgimonas zhirmunskyi TaxID=2964767 RepID=A0AAJ1U7Z7_9RHOB|nr:DMT family transporter [Rhodoalgimonas zhirmunskyi]MDQ2095275.1 DMT family transporter [Rhodoalgimonas zhirmunskyi]